MCKLTQHASLGISSPILSLFVAMLAATAYSQPPSSDTPAAAGVVLPSGKSLAPADFYSLNCVKGTAGQLLDAVLSASLGASCMNCEGSLVLYGHKQDKLVGYAVCFWPGKDPQSVYERKRDERKRTAEAADPEPATVWDDVAIRCCTHYDSDGKQNGWILLWNEDGTKQYFRDYSYTRALRCLFQRDQLRAVIESGPGQGQRRVHLLSGWKIEKTFASVEEAKADGGAQGAVYELDSITDALRRSDSAFQEAHKDAWKKYIAQVRVQKRQRISGNIARHNAEKDAMGTNLLKTVQSARASRTTVWDPGNNYLPVDIR